MEKALAKLGPMPRILCWKCRKLTPFELDHCQHCGSAFAGGTGGAYGAVPAVRPRIAPVTHETSRTRERNLTQVFEDLQLVHDVSGPSKGRQAGRPGGAERSAQTYQCPACGRFVSEEATDCVCGVRFGSLASNTFACPECGSHVPAGSGACPVCSAALGPSGDLDLLLYSCPRCGSRVASDQSRCFCGVWFAD